MLDFFARLFGPYPFAAYTVVITDDRLDIPLEAQGMSTFGSNFLTSDWDDVRLVAHELSHQWFGNAVTLVVVARHLAARGLRLLLRVAVVRGVGGPLRGRARARPLAQALRRAAGPAARPTRGRTSCSTTGSTSAAPCCCTRCGSRSATTLFFELLRTWVDRNRYGSVTTAMFEALAVEISGAPLGDLFDAWLRRRPLPELPPVGGPGTAPRR